MDLENDCHFDESNIDISFVELFLSKYDGGTIYISKKYFSEGIAFIIIRNERKRNAVSGKLLFIFCNMSLQWNSLILMFFYCIYFAEM